MRPIFQPDDLVGTNSCIKHIYLYIVLTQNKYSTYQQQCQGRSWLSAPVLCPGGGPPSWGRSVRCLWGPKAPSGTFWSLSRWCQSSQDKRRRCQARCLGRSHPCRHLRDHHLKKKRWLLQCLSFKIAFQEGISDQWGNHWISFYFYQKENLSVGRPVCLSIHHLAHSPSESSWSGLKTSLQLSFSSGIPSLSSSWSHTSPFPSLSWSAWLALGM